MHLAHALLLTKFTECAYITVVFLDELLYLRFLLKVNAVIRYFEFYSFVSWTKLGFYSMMLLNGTGVLYGCIILWIEDDIFIISTPLSCYELHLVTGQE
ncbi:hypothetical protein ACJX0J_023039, partial [Zea mays]